MLTLLANLLCNDFKIIIMIYQEEGTYFKLNEHIEIIEINNFKSSLLKTNLNIYKILKTHNCDYYISLDSNSVILNGFFLPFKTKLIIWEHFSIMNNFNKFLFKISRFYSVLRADRFVLLSKNEILDWNKNYKLPSSKTVLIYNPITINRKKVLLENKSKFKTILAIGNNIEVKGFDMLIEIWSSMPKMDWNLKIIGLPEEQIIKAEILISKLNFQNEIFVQGSEIDIEGVYNETSIFCLTSRKEATPLVLIESQTFGIPAVVFNNSPGVLEIIQDSALISKFADKNDFKNNLLTLMLDSNLYEQVHQKALDNSLRFSQNEFKNKWLEILN